MKTIGAIFFCCIIAGCGVAPQSAKASKPTLTGPAFKATLIAYDKFATKISVENKYGELGVFLGKIDNYDLFVTENERLFTIKFIPRPYKGSRLNGGAAEYAIDKNDYRILDIKMYK